MKWEIIFICLNTDSVFYNQVIKNTVVGKEVVLYYK